MSDPLPRESGSLASVSDAIDAACDRFEAAWETALTGGTRPNLEDYLDAVTPTERGRLLLELVLLELHYRGKAGEQATAEDYLARFPLLSRDRLHRKIRRAQHAAWASSLGEVPGTVVERSCQVPPESAAPPVAVPGYEVLGVLGRGGMGVVYKARQAALGRVVALKMILHADHAGPAERQRFRREAEALGRLQQPHIVQVFDVGECQDLPYFSMEYCAGGSLADQLDGTPWEPRRAAALVRTLAETMQAAHQAQVVHRDLKPANVLLDAEGQPKITDFGLAKKLDERPRTQTGAILGTPNYMAPEQAQGKTREVGPAADVYALGAILYELLTGRPPFQAATPLDTVLRVIGEEAVPVRRLQPKTPRDLETVCHKCLQKDSRKRYPSAGALAEDLGRFLAGEPIRARPVGALERGWKWVRRKPLLASLLAAVVFLFVAGVAASTHFGMMAAERASKVTETLAQVDEARGKAVEERDRAESTLVRSWTRPLGYKRGPLNPAEWNALWDVATSDSDRARIAFLREALGEPMLAERIGRRAELAVHAAVGLDAGRREQVKHLLLNKFQDGEMDPRVRQACVYLGAALDLSEEAFTDQLAQATVALLEQTASADELWLQRGVLVALARRLGPDRAAAAAEAVLAAMAKRNDVDAVWALGGAVEALTGRMTPERAGAAAEAAAQRFLDAMARLQTVPEADPLATSISNLGWGVARLAGRMPAERAAVVANTAIDRLLGAVADGRNPMARAAVSSPVAALLERLPAERAAVVAGGAARQVVQAMATADPSMLSFFGAALEPLADRLSADQAAAITEAILENMARKTPEKAPAFLMLSNQPDLVSAFGGALKALARRLDGDRAAAGVDKALALMTPQAQPFMVAGLGSATAALTGRLRPERRAAAAAAAIDRLLDALGQTTDSQLDNLGKSQAGGGVGMAGQRDLNKLMTASNALFELFTLVHVVGELAVLLPADRAAAAAQTIAAAMAKRSNLYALAALGRAVAALAERMPPDKRAVAVTAAADKILHAMARTADAPALATAVPTVAALAARLPADKAHAAAAQAADKLLRDMAETTDQTTLATLGYSLGSLAQHLNADQAVTAAQKVVDGMSRLDAGSLPSLAILGGAVASLAGQMPRDRAGVLTAAALEKLLHAATAATFDASDVRDAVTQLAKHLPADRVAALAQTALDGMGRATSAAALAPLQNAVGALAERAAVEDLVDLLKGPTCVEEARSGVVAALRHKVSCPSEGYWNVIDWVRVHQPGLDLLSPPPRPADQPAQPNPVVPGSPPGGRGNVRRGS
jgi:hypothetical protein